MYLLQSVLVLEEKEEADKADDYLKGLDYASGRLDESVVHAGAHPKHHNVTQYNKQILRKVTGAQRANCHVGRTDGQIVLTSHRA